MNLTRLVLFYVDFGGDLCASYPAGPSPSPCEFFSVLPRPSILVILGHARAPWRARMSMSAPVERR